jgi:hypothetical protein
MSTIIGAPLQERRPVTIATYPTTASDVFSVGEEEALATNPGEALENLDQSGFFFKPYSRTEVYTGDIAKREGPKDVISSDEANSLYGETGLKFDAPVSAGYAKTSAEKKQQENERTKIVARAPGGFGTGAAYIAGAFYGSLRDPINIGLSFLPIVGEARYAKLVQLYGQHGGRLAKGAIEGAAGAALVEPIVYAGAQVPQYNYGLADSLLNIAVGTGLGGGLHFAGGKIADAWRGRKVTTLSETGSTPIPTRLDEKIDLLPTEAKADVLRAAIGKIAKDEPLDIEAQVKAALDDIPFDDDFVSGKEPPAPRGFIAGELSGTKYADYTKPTPKEMRWLEGVVADLNAAYKGYKTFDYTREGVGGTPDVKGIKGNFPQWFKDLNESGENVSREYISKVFDKMKSGAPLGKKEARIARTLWAQAMGDREDNVRQMIQHRQQKARENEYEIDAVAERERMADDLPNDSNVITRTMDSSDDIEAMNAELDALIQAERELGNLSEDEIAAIEAANDFAIEAEGAAKGLIAAATCIFRKA